MGIFPEIYKISNENTNKKLGIDFEFDESTGQHIIANGSLAICSNRENIQNWIRKVIRTQINSYEVYIKDEKERFGVNIYDKLGTKDKGYWLSELKREITEQLEKHSMIESVTDYKAEYKNRKLTIYVVVMTQEGVIESEVDRYA